MFPKRLLFQKRLYNKCELNLRQIDQKSTAYLTSVDTHKSGINIFQVAPISVTDGMMNCTANHLSDRGSLFIYGPFKVDGAYTTPSNEEFDRTLLSYGVPEWGLKDITDITRTSQKYGLDLKEKVDMPGNNFILIYGFR